MLGKTDTWNVELNENKVCWEKLKHGMLNLMKSIFLPLKIISVTAEWYV